MEEKRWIVAEGGDYDEHYAFYGPFTQAEAEAFTKKMQEKRRSLEWDAIELDPPEKAT